jgi:hypothetical protein
MPISNEGPNSKVKTIRIITNIPAKGLNGIGYRFIVWVIAWILLLVA